MYLFIDTETTRIQPGFDNYRPYTEVGNWPRMVSFGAWVYEKGKTTPYHMLIVPKGFTISKSDTEIHGITHNMAVNRGVLPDVALLIIGNLLQEAPMVVCHNKNFDIPVIKAEMHRAGMPASHIKKVFDRDIFCTSEDTRQVPGLLLPGKQFVSLDRLFEFCNKRPLKRGKHNAQDDARICMECFFYLKRNNLI